MSGRGKTAKRTTGKRGRKKTKKSIRTPPAPTTTPPTTQTSAEASEPFVSVFDLLMQEDIDAVDDDAPEPPAKQRRVTEARVNEALGAEEEQQQQSADVAGRVRDASAAARDRFYNTVHVAARYGNADAARQFINSSGELGGDDDNNNASAVMTSAAQVSRIDEALARSSNRRARDRQQQVRSAAGPTVGALLEDDSLVGIDQFVSRVLGLRAEDGINGDLLSEPYQVDGLSVAEPNPQYEQLQRDRAALEQRQQQLENERLDFARQRKAISRVRLSNDSRDREEARQRLMQYASLESVELLKPASAVREINERWRSLLGQTLIQLNEQYKRTTAQSIQSALGDQVANDSGERRVALYMQNVVNPIMDEYIDQLRSASYEDMPLTLELLELYFYRFLDEVLAALLDEREQLTADELQRRADVLAAQAERGFDAGLVEAGQRRRDMAVDADDDNDEESLFATERLGGGGADNNLSFEERERRMTQEYMRQALFMYATPVYRQWLRQWLVTLGEPLPADTRATLTRAVDGMITGRQRVQSARDRATGRTGPRYEPWSEATVIEQYSKLIRQDVALHRTNQLLSNADANQLRSEVADALIGGPAGVQEPDDIQLSTDVLVYPRLARFDILEQERSRVEQELRRAAQASRVSLAAETDDNDDEPVTAGIDRDLVASVADLNRRAASIADQLAFYGPVRNGLTPHAPLDPPVAGDAEWSPFNLAYPLDVDATRRQESDVYQSVMRLTDVFDANQRHERADELRSILSFEYAEQLLQRELMQIEYALRNLGQPTRQTALDMERFVTDSRPLELAYEIKLRDELALLATAPSQTLVDSRVARKQRELRERAWTANLLFTPRYTSPDGRELTSAAPERIIDSQQLPVGVTRGAFTVRGSEATLGGRYRIELVRAAAAAGNNQADEDEEEGEIEENGERYVSRFAALVKIVARCQRDGSVYELGTEQHGEAVWTEPPRDEARRNFAEGIEVLVTRGQTAYEQLLVQRRQSRSTPVQRSLYLPPWGSDDEHSLLVAWRMLTAADFSFHRIVDRAVERIGGEVRTELRALANKLPTAAGREIVRRQAALPVSAQFAALLDRNGFRDALTDKSNVSAVARATAQARIAQKIGAGQYAERTLGNASQLPLAGMPFARVGVFADPAVLLREARGASIDQSELSTMERELFDELPQLFDDDALPLADVRPIALGEQRSISSLPLASVLRAFYAPIVWHMLTWRERRFIDTMYQRFESFALDFRAAERRTLFYAPLQTGMPWSEHAPRPLNESLGIFDRAGGARDPAPLVTADVDEAISRQLASLSATAVRTKLGREQYSIGDRYTNWNERQRLPVGLLATNDERQRRAAQLFLRDCHLCAEFDELVRQRLLNTGLLVADERVFYAMGSANDDEQRVTLRRAVQPRTDGDGTLRSYSGERPVWRGSHSYQTAQPDEYEVFVDKQRGAFVVQRGSVPLNKGYDFDGLHDIIAATAARLTATVREGANLALDRTTYARLVDSLADQLADMELAYNYLAFVAPAMRDGRIITGYELQQMVIDDRDLFFRQLRLLASQQTALLV